MLLNLLELDQVALITVTAPGTDAGLIWDTSVCTHPPHERCSGPKGCRVQTDAAERCNAVMERSWPQLHARAAMRARRSLGRARLSIVAAKVWERQDRGVNHLHLVVPYRMGPERRAIDTYVEALKECAPAYGFGFVDCSAKMTGRGGMRAAAYVAKYVGKATAEELRVSRPVHVGAFLTSKTRVTMRALRWRRFLHSRGLDCHATQVLGVVDALSEVGMLDRPASAILFLQGRQAWP